MLRAPEAPPHPPALYRTPPHFPAHLRTNGDQRLFESVLFHFLEKRLVTDLQQIGRLRLLTGGVLQRRQYLPALDLGQHPARCVSKGSTEIDLIPRIEGSLGGDPATK